MPTGKILPLSLIWGRKSGVKEGMIFEVYKEGEIVKHPKTGEILYVKKIDSGTVKITSVQDKIAKGIILEEIGETGIQYGGSDQVPSHSDRQQQFLWNNQQYNRPSGPSVCNDNTVQCRGKDSQHQAQI